MPSTSPDPSPFLGIDALLPEIILALGAALAIGMGLALFGPAVRARYGMAPPRPDPGGPPTVGQRLTGKARVRALFLFVVGVVMAIWGVASIVAR